VPCTYYIKIEAEFLTSPTIATEQHKKHRDKQRTPPRLSNNMTRSKPLHRDYGYHQPSLLTTTTMEDGHLRNRRTPRQRLQRGRRHLGGCRCCRHQQSRAKLSLSELQVPRPPPVTNTTPGHTTASHIARQSQSATKGSSTTMQLTAPRRPPPWRLETPRARTLTCLGWKTMLAHDSRHSPHHGAFPAAAQRA
jgi:hypothetical protein